MTGTTSAGASDGEPYWPVGTAADRAGVSHLALAEDVRAGRIRARSVPAAGRPSVEVRLVHAGDVARCYPCAARFLARAVGSAGAGPASSPARDQGLVETPAIARTAEGPALAAADSPRRPRRRRGGGLAALLLGSALGLTGAVFLDDTDPLGPGGAREAGSAAATTAAAGPALAVEREGVPGLTSGSTAESTAESTLGPISEPAPVVSAPTADAVTSTPAEAREKTQEKTQETTQPQPMALPSAEPEPFRSAERSGAVAPTMGAAFPPRAAGPRGTSEVSAPSPWDSATRSAWLDEVLVPRRALQAGDKVDCSYGALLAGQPEAALALGPCIGAGRGTASAATHRVHGLPCCAHHAFVERMTRAHSDARARNAALAEAQASMGDGVLPALLLLRAERSATHFLRASLHGWARAGLDEGAGPPGPHRWSLGGRRSIDGVSYLALRLDSWAQRTPDSAPRTFELELLLGSGPRGDRLDAFRWVDEEALAGGR